MFFKPSRFRQTNDHFKSGDTIALQAVYKADSLPCKKGHKLWEGRDPEPLRQPPLLAHLWQQLFLNNFLSSITNWIHLSFYAFYVCLAQLENTVFPQLSAHLY